MSRQFWATAPWTDARQAEQLIAEQRGLELSEAKPIEGFAYGTLAGQRSASMAPVHIGWPSGTVCWVFRGAEVIALCADARTAERLLPHSVLCWAFEPANVASFDLDQRWSLWTLPAGLTVRVETAPRVLLLRTLLARRNQLQGGANALR